MELKRAKEVLEGMGIVHLADKHIHSKGGALSFVIVGAEYAKLDGNFNVLELEAIATWMRDPEGVVGA